MTVSGKSGEQGALMMNTNAAIGVYASHTEAEDAVKEVQKAGVEMKPFSIIFS